MPAPRSRNDVEDAGRDWRSLEEIVQLVGDLLESNLSQNLLVGFLQRHLEICTDQKWDITQETKKFLTFDHLLGKVSAASRGSNDVEDAGSDWRSLEEIVQLIGDLLESNLPQNLLVGFLQRLPASRGSKDAKDRSRSWQEVDQVRGVNFCSLGCQSLGKLGMTLETFNSECQNSQRSYRNQTSSECA